MSRSVSDVPDAESNGLAGNLRSAVVPFPDCRAAQLFVETSPYSAGFSQIRKVTVVPNLLAEVAVFLVRKG